jgi:hypothetical protein
MTLDDEAKAINARYRAYCDACESGQLEKVPSFWAIPSLFTVDEGGADTVSVIVTSKEQLVTFYRKLFGPTTGVDETLIDDAEVTFFGDRLATIKTKLRHLARGALHDKQHAIYGCRKVAGEWEFISHLSVDSKG